MSSSASDQCFHGGGESRGGVELGGGREGLGPQRGWDLTITSIAESPMSRLRQNSQQRLESHCGRPGLSPGRGLTTSPYPKEIYQLPRIPWDSVVAILLRDLGRSVLGC